MVAIVPAVVSLNRGLWIGLGVLILYVALRYVLAGQLWICRRVSAETPAPA